MPKGKGQTHSETTVFCFNGEEYYVHVGAVNRKARELTVPKLERQKGYTSNVKGVSKCFTCKGPMYAGICMYKGCAIVLKPTSDQS